MTIRSKRPKRRNAGRYKSWCDNHSDRRATWAFKDTVTGEQRGLCDDCFDEEREQAIRRKAIQAAKLARKKVRSSAPRDDKASPRAVRYASGLTTGELLKKLADDGFDHPGRLARALGLSDKGTRWEVAKSISKKYGPRK